MAGVDASAKYTEFARIYLGLKEGGMKTKDAFASLQNMKYDKSLSVLNRHIRAIESTGHALAQVKRTGKKRKLDEDKEEEMHEWVLDQNMQNLPFGLREFQKQIWDSWGLEMSLMTCSKVLTRLGHSRKTCQTKTSGFNKTNATLWREYWEFILEMKRLNLFVVPPNNIRSQDVTYSRKPVTAVTTFSPVNSGKQRSAKKVKTYTNAIVTMISADGVNHTPCIMWTYDPRLNLDQKNTARGNGIKQALLDSMEKYGITPDRVRYVQSNKHLYGESADIYEQFNEFYRAKGKLQKTDLILHDGGNAFKRKKVSIFDAKGFTNHQVYPADVHQYLSPNDNKLHGCKAKWYAEYYKFEDEISPSLRLMQLIDLETVSRSMKYFQDNLLNVKKGHLVGIIGA